MHRRKKLLAVLPGYFFVQLQVRVVDDCEHLGVLPVFPFSDLKRVAFYDRVAGMETERIFYAYGVPILSRAVAYVTGLPWSIPGEPAFRR